MAVFAPDDNQPGMAEAMEVSRQTGERIVWFRLVRVTSYVGIGAVSGCASEQAKLRSGLAGCGGSGEFTGQCVRYPQPVGVIAHEPLCVTFRGPSAVLAVRNSSVDASDPADSLSSL